jgi:hypothetical protein
VSLVLATVSDPVKLPASMSENPSGGSQEESRPESKGEEADDLVLVSSKVVAGCGK